MSQKNQVWIFTSKFTDYYFTWFDLQRKKYNSLFASHKHSFVLSCISVKHFMSNATPQNMFETLCITITSSISSLLLRKEASISRTNKKKFFAVDEKRKTDALYSKILIFVQKFPLENILIFCAKIGIWKIENSPQKKLRIIQLSCQKSS